LKYWPKLINQSKPDLEVETPLVHAIKMHRTTIAETFFQHNALGDVEVNQQCLRNVGAVLADEALSYNGLYFEAQGELARRCVELVAAAAPDLVNATDEYGFTPLMLAAQFHDELTVKALLRAGADVNAATPAECDHRTALNLLTESKLHCSEDTIIELLLEAGADMDKHRTTSGKTLLHLAARDNIAWIARRCLGLEADINDTDEYGQTPLHVAAMYGSVQAAQVLLQGGANTELGHHRGTYNERAWTGLTPIAIAATGSRKGFIKMLLDYQASPIARPSTRQTVFHLAVSESRPDMMAVLVSIPDLCLPSVLEMKDERDGLTALQLCAAYAEKFEHARLLVQAGADVNAVVSLGDRELSVLDIVHYARELAIENDSAEDDVTGAVEPELEDWDKLNGYLQHHGAKRRQADDGGADFRRMHEEAFSLD
jgi:ankyrin repeat protein